MDIIKLNTGRNCLRYIIRAYKIKDLWLPYYICPVIRTVTILENCKIHFYHIDNTFSPTKIFKNDDFILYPNYFGICAKNVEKLSAIYKNLIIDNAHAFFMKPCGLASFSSLRKFFNVTDGAYLYCLKTLKENFKKSTNKKQLQTEKDFFINESFLDTENIKIISDETQNLISKINLSDEKEKRLEKFFNWHKNLGDTNKLKIKLTKDDVPYVYPYITNDDDFVNKLHGLTIFRLWNNLPSSFLEYNFYRHLIPIPLS